MKTVFTWFSKIDSNLWGDEVKGNRYLATILLMFAFLSGLSVGVAPAMGDIIPFFSDVNVVSVTALMVYVAALAVYESFCIATDLLVASLRSLLLVLLIFVLYGGGCLLGRMLS